MDPAELLSAEPRQKGASLPAPAAAQWLSTPTKYEAPASDEEATRAWWRSLIEECEREDEAKARAEAQP